jgi:hypothetical protein
VKKLAIGVLVVLVASACRRQAVVTSVPTQQPPSTPAASNAAGGATASEAVTRFLAAVKAQDLQALSNVWGTKDGGPARNDRRYMTVEMMEQRMIIMIRCLRHDSWTVLRETAVTGGDRQITVQLKYKALTVPRDFTATLGPGGRWYVSVVQMDQPPSAICSAT